MPDYGAAPPVPAGDHDDVASQRQSAAPADSSTRRAAVWFLPTLAAALALCVIYASSSSAQQPEGARGEASGAAAPSSRLAALNWRRASSDRADRGAASSASDAVATVAAGDAATAREAALAAAWTPSDPNSTWWTEHHSTHSVSSSSSSSGASSSDDASSAADDAAADGAASASSSSASRTSDASAPHIVFVLVDDLGANDISYASTDLPNITTAIDALAADGVTLGACAYYSLHMCTPARAALLTGRYPYRIGMQLENVKPDSPWGLPLGLTTLPERLRDEAGYKTHAVGKWGLGHYAPEYLPSRRGFESFYGYLSDEIDYFSHAYPSAFGETDDDMRYYTDFLELNSAAPRHYGFLNEQNDTYSTLLYTRKALDIVESHAAENRRAAGDDDDATAAAPLFLYYASQNVHGPLDVPPLSMFSPEQWARIAHVPQKAHRRQIAASLLALDWSVERLVNGLRDEGLWDDTVLVVASDNGGCWAQGGSNLPLRGGKHFLWEGGVKVPAFVHSPLLPSARRGATFDGLFSVVDWYATLMYVAQVSVDQDDELLGGVARHDSLNQWHAIAGAMDEGAARAELVLNLNSWTLCCVKDAGLSETCAGFLSECDSVYLARLTKANGTRAALRSGPWKIILNEFPQPWYGVVEGMDLDGAPLAPGTGTNCGDNPNTMAHSFLYNIEADPSEQHDMWDERPDVVANLTARVFDLARHEAVSQWQPETTEAYHFWDDFGGVIRPWHETAVPAAPPAGAASSNATTTTGAVTQPDGTPASSGAASDSPIVAVDDDHAGAGR